MLGFVFDSDGVEGFLHALSFVEVSDVIFWLDVGLNSKTFISLFQGKARSGWHRNHVVLDILLGDVRGHALAVLPEG